MKNKKILIFAALLCVLVATGVAAFYFYKKQPKLSASDHFTNAEKYLSNQENGKAYRNFKEAARQEPGNLKYQKKFAEISFKFAQKSEAKLAAQKAWDLGDKSKEIANILISLKEGTKEEVLKYSLEKILKFCKAEERDLSEIKASVYFRAGQVDKSLEIWEKLFKDRPKASLVNAIASALIQLKKPEKAKTHLSEFRKTDLLDISGYSTLLYLQGMKDADKEVDEIIKEMSQDNLYIPSIQLWHANYLINRGKMLDSQKILEKLIQPSMIGNSALLSSEGFIEELNKNEDELINQMRMKISKEDMTILNTKSVAEFKKRGLILKVLNSLLADKDFVKKDQLVSEKISAETKQMFEGENVSVYQRNREVLTEMFPKNIMKASVNSTAIQARLNLSYIYFNTLKKDEIKKLKALTNAENKWSEGEHMLYDTLVAYLSNKPEGRNFQSARELIPGHPVIELFHAKGLFVQRKVEESLGVYEALVKKNPNVMRNPFFVTEFARTLMAAGKSEGALAAISRNHQRKIYTKDSLKLYRNLMFRTNKQENAEEVQDFLEKAFKDDASVQWEGAMISMQTKKFDDASKALEKLAKKYPDEERIELAKLNIFLAKKDFEGCIKACETSKLDAEKLKMVKAQAFVGLNKVKKALAIYESVTSKDLVPFVDRILAGIYLRTGEMDKADGKFNAWMKSDPKAPGAYFGSSLIAFQKRELAKAESLNAKTLELSPKMLQARNLNAQIEFTKGNLGKAIGICDEIMLTVPEDRQARFLKAQCLLLGNSWSEAHAILFRLSKEMPENQAVQTSWIRALSAQKKYSQALLEIESILEKQKDNKPVQVMKFRLLGNAKMYDEAKKYLETIKSQFPKDFYLLSQMWLYEIKKDYKSAIELGKDHLDQVPVLLRWAVLKVKLGESEGVFEKVSKAKVVQNSYMLLASEALSVKKYAFAVKCYKKVMEIGPSNPVVMNNLAWTACQVKDYPENEVITLAKGAMEKLPNNVEIFDTLIYVYDHYKKYQDIVTVMKKNNIEKARRHSRILYRAGIAFEQTGDLGSSLTYLKESKSVEASSPSADFPIKLASLDIKIKEVENKIKEAKKKKANN